MYEVYECPGIVSYPSRPIFICNRVSEHSNMVFPQKCP